MAMYRCWECDEIKDGDWDVCDEHPTREGELICESCRTELEDEMEEEVNGEDFVKPKVPFAKGQSFIDIAKEEQERILAENEKWYGQRYHTEQAETHRSLSTDIEGHWK